MNKFLLAIVFSLSAFAGFSQNIIVDQVNVSTIDEGVKVNLITRCFSGAYLGTSNYTIEGNIISLKVCYVVTPLAIVVNLNDNITIPLEWEYDNYTVNVNVYDSFQMETQICNYDSSSHTYSFELLSIDPHELQNSKLLIFPNPTTGKINFNLKEITNIAVFDISGRLVKSEEHFTGELNLELLPNGLYLIKAFSEKGISATKVILYK